MSTTRGTRAGALYERESEALTRLYDLATGDEDARVCRDIPESACRHQPVNFLAHVAALVATKAGDLLMDVKTVLSWILAALGAPSWMISLLVPIRESLSLLPQLAVAGVMRRHARRKWFWVAGSVMQGLAVAAMAPVAVWLEGATAGAAILGLLVVFSLARGVCSVSQKDVLGKTVSKTRRGAVSGYAASFAGGLSLLIGGWLYFRGEQIETVEVFALLLFGAGALWMLAAGVYASVREPAGATEGGASALAEAWRSVALLGRDSRLRWFLYTRTLLLSTALSAPFYVVVARGAADAAIGVLGLMIVATGGASMLSSTIWGKMADRSSRRVLIAAALIAAASGISAFAYATWASTHSAWWFALLFFLLGVAHSGVRIGRKTYLVDMARQDDRAAYVAISNTLIGAALLAAGSVGLLSVWIGDSGIILLLALIALAAAALAAGLEEVQQD